MLVEGGCATYNVKGEEETFSLHIHVHVPYQAMLATTIPNSIFHTLSTNFLIISLLAKNFPPANL